MSFNCAAFSSPLLLLLLFLLCAFVTFRLWDYLCYDISTLYVRQADDQGNDMVFISSYDKIQIRCTQMNLYYYPFSSNVQLCNLQLNANNQNHLSPETTKHFRLLAVLLISVMKLKDSFFSHPMQTSFFTEPIR